MVIFFLSSFFFIFSWSISSRQVIQMAIAILAIAAPGSTANNLAIPIAVPSSITNNLAIPIAIPTSIANSLATPSPWREVERTKLASMSASLINSVRLTARADMSVCLPR